MGPLTVAAFFIACLLGVGYPALASTLCLGLFPIKQLLQASSGYFRDSLTGSQMINFVIGGVGVLAAVRRVLANPDQLRGYVTSSMLLTLALYGWGVTTCWWSYSRPEGFASFVINVPYIVLYLVVLPALVANLDDWHRITWIWLLLNTCLSALILTNPEFTTWAGRLVLNLGVAGLKVTKTNPLEIGAAGGVCIIVGILYQGTGLKTISTLLVRIAAVLLGTALVIRSGSRGQFLFAIISTFAAFPVARKITDIRRALIGVLGLVVLLVAILAVADRVRSSGTSDDERRWTSAGFESGSNVRSGNIALLLGEYASSPTRWLTGLGYQSYYALDPTQEYSHCIAVDSLAELGLIGAGLFALVFGRAGWQTLQILRQDRVQESVHLRNGLGCLFGILLFYFFLANKQGNLAGSSALFGFVLILARIHRAELQAVAERLPEGELADEFVDAAPSSAATTVA